MAKTYKIDFNRIREKNNESIKTLNSIQKEDSAWFNRDIRIFKKKLNNKFKESFFNELYNLLSSGIDIITAIRLIKNDNNASINIINSIDNKIIEGLTLSEAMISVGGFSRYEVFSIQIGEESGRLNNVLKDLSVYYGKLAKQNRQIISSLSYPVIVLLVAFAAVYFMLSFVVPMFTDVFNQFGGNLPGITTFVISIANFLGNNFIFILLFHLVLIFIGFKNRNKIWFRKYSTDLVLKIPVVGNLIRKIYLSRLLNTLSMLMEAKVPLVVATDLCRKMILFYPIEISLDQVQKELVVGNSLSQTLEKHTIYPKKMVAMVRIGEEVNQIDSFLKNLSSQYSAEVDFITDSIGKIIEPFIIIFLGIIVAVIMIAMYLPLFQIGNAF